MFLRLDQVVISELVVEVYIAKSPTAQKKLKSTTTLVTQRLKHVGEQILAISNRPL